MKTEHMNDLPYQNDLPQEVGRWVATCIRCYLQFINTLTDSISYDDTDLYPNVRVILKLLLTLPVSSCACGWSFTALRRLKTWCVEQYWLKIACVCCRCFTSTVLIATVGHVNPEAVLKRWDSSGNRKIHLAFTE